jgi:hypothetical protein
MLRAKMLAVLAGMIATLAVSAAPAFAEFESTSGRQTGQGKATSVTLEGGGATLECTSAEGTGTILTDIGGSESTKGKVMQLKTTKWNGCKAKSKEIKEVTPKVKACVLDLRQESGQMKAKGSVVKECTVETTVLFLTCTIHVLVEKPSEQVNSGLEANTLTNEQANLLIKAEDVGVTTTATGTCPGITGSKEGKQKATIRGEGANWL